MTMRHGILKSIAICLIANSLVIHGASAQNKPKNAPPAACPPTTTIKAPQLYGIWQVTFINPPAGLPARAVLLLEKHEEFADSLSGLVSRDSVTASGHAAKPRWPVMSKMAL